MSGSNQEQLRCDLEALGLSAGSTVLVHASLRRVRPDAGGPTTVLAALRDVIGERGTIVVPAQTTWNSTTSRSFRAATAGMSDEEIARYLAELPAFDPRTTSSSGMGVLAEHVRMQSDSVRSAHPMTSFAACGRRARELMETHDLECLLGDRSPLGAIYRADAFVLHLGTGYDRSTIFHLGEWRADPHRRGYQCKLFEAPADWVAFEDVDYDDSDFPALGAKFERSAGVVRRGTAGSAEALLYPAREAADFAQRWVKTERRAGGTAQWAQTAPARA